MLPARYRDFLKGLQDKGICMYVYAPTGGCLDINLEELEQYLNDPDKFFADIEKDKEI